MNAWDRHDHLLQVLFDGMPWAAFTASQKGLVTVVT